MHAVELDEIALRLIPETLERRSGLPAAIAHQLVRLLDGVETLERGIRVTIRVFRGDELAVHALDVRGFVVGGDAEHGRGRRTTRRRARLRLEPVHRVFERTPIFHAKLELVNRDVLHLRTGHGVRHADDVGAEGRKCRANRGDTLDLLGGDSLLLRLGDVHAVLLEILARLRREKRDEREGQRKVRRATWASAERRASSVEGDIEREAMIGAMARDGFAKARRTCRTQTSRAIFV